LVQCIPVFADQNLLVGAQHFSDAGVYRLADGMAVVQSLDFFPPLVDDPFVYGQIAAANALGDVYAIGARPVTALNIVCFPDDRLALELLEEILRGGAERVAEAGAVIAGGHSVRDAEIKYGLSVTGVVDPARMMTNEAAAPGDALVLTKALGTGFVTTALRAGRCPDETLAAATASMVALNRAASEAAQAVDARAATDVTGFGLAGHAGEMARASGVTFAVELGRLPILPGVEELVRRGYRTRANATNRAHAVAFTRLDAGAGGRDEILFDPQTSGGLLVAVKPDRLDELLGRCRDGGAETATVVGRVEAPGEATLIVT
jgi:selenide,water dikinase